MAKDLYSHGKIITPGTPVVPGDGFMVACSSAGNLRVVMGDGSFMDVYAGVGTAEFRGYAIKDVNAAGTSATVSVTVLD